MAEPTPRPCSHWKISRWNEAEGTAVTNRLHSYRCDECETEFIEAEAAAGTGLRETLVERVGHVRLAFDRVWVGLDCIARSKFTMAAQGDGFAEGYESGLHEARGIALVTMEEAYEAFGEKAGTLSNAEIRLAGANLQVARIIGDILAALAAAPAAPERGLDAHEPGANHRYRIECEVCGQRGTVNLSIEPQRAAYADEHAPGEAT